MLRDTIPGLSNINFKKDPITGLLLFYDQNRSMYISTDRATYNFGIDHSNINKSVWMKVEGNVNTLTNGFISPRDSIITCISVSCQNSPLNCIFRIVSDSTLTEFSTISLTSVQSNITDNLSINVNQGDNIRVYADVISGFISYPLLSIELAWR